MVNLVWVFLIVAIIGVVSDLWSITIGAAWEPTSRKRTRRMLEVSGVGPTDIVYDLGSGDGRIILEAARTCHAKAVGIEADPLRVLLSRMAVVLLRLRGQVRVVWGNFFHTDLSKATVVTLFLSQGTNRRLESKLMTELKPGTRVVSHVWTFDNWSPALRDVENELFLYIVQKEKEPTVGVPASKIRV